MFEPLEDRSMLSTFVPGEVLIQFDTSVDQTSRASTRAQIAGNLLEQIHTNTMKASGQGVLERVAIGRGISLANVIERLGSARGVVFAEPNWVYTPTVVSNDTHYLNGNLWNMYSDDSPSAIGPAGTTNQYGTQAEEAWNNGFIGSNSVYIGVIDEGIQYTHPDLAANVWTNPFDPIDGVDNDGNGKIDDTQGWDFFSNDRTVYDGTGDDHATHVAGTIGGKGGNGAGVAGLNWNVTMISTKFLGSNGGSTSGAVQALDYLTDLKTRHGLNIIATNNSWGGGGFSQSLLNAITRSANQGILFVAAAGNSASDNDAAAWYPSNYDTTSGAGFDSVIAVASITSTGAISSFSSYGATKVDLGAPGSSIYSTLPSNTYGSYSGTSMATPHVTGALALYAAAHPGSTALQLRNALLGNTTATASLAGKTVTGGRLDLSKLLGEVAELPSLSVSDVSVSEGNSGTSPLTFTVNLSAPSGLTTTVNFATANDSADAADYQSNSGSLTFDAGETSKTITVLIIGDSTFEPNDTFFVDLSESVNASISDGQGIGTIINDENFPSISINDRSVSEGGSVTFTVTLSNTSDQTITVNYATANVNATAPADYSAGSGTLTFSPGATTKTILVAINPDLLDELHETFVVNLSGAVNAILADNQGIGTILDDDPATSVSLGDVSGNEGLAGTTAYTFTVSLIAPSGKNVKLNYATADGTATIANNDYQAKSGSVTVPAGQTSATITILVNGDSANEAHETFLVNVTSATAASIGDGQAVGTIVNDDGLILSVDDVSLSEGNNGTTAFTFTVNMSSEYGETVTVDFATANGTATTANSDYVGGTGTLTFTPGQTSKTVVVLVNGDLFTESNETFFVDLSNPLNANIGDGQGQGTILNDDPIHVTISGASVVEGNSGQTVATFTVDLSLPSDADISIDFATTDGTATAGSDYTATSGRLTFVGGVSHQTISVVVNGDLLYEPNETFFVNLSNASGGAEIGVPQGLGTIVNDEISLSISDVTQFELATGVKAFTFIVSLSSPGTQTVTVQFATADETATIADIDYYANSGTLTFNPGQTSKVISVQVKGDRKIETDENFFVNLNNPTNAGMSDGQGVGTILNDDVGATALADRQTPSGFMALAAAPQQALAANDDRQSAQRSEKAIVVLAEVNARVNPAALKGIDTAQENVSRSVGSDSRSRWLWAVNL